MPIMLWDSKFDIGVKSMNDEHKQILDLMNKLYDQNTAKVARPEIQKTLVALAQCTINHFKDEEAYMESIGFPEFEVHKIVHKKLLEKFTEHKDAFEKGSSPTISQSFFDFLRMWLSAHIQGIDAKYGAHSKSCGKAA